MHSWSGYSDLHPQLPHPMHTLGILSLEVSQPVGRGPSRPSCLLQSLQGWWALSHTGAPPSPGAASVALLPSPLALPWPFSPASFLSSDFSSPNLGNRLLVTQIPDSPSAPRFSLLGGWCLSFCKQVLRDGLDWTRLEFQFSLLANTPVPRPPNPQKCSAAASCQ